jgi:chitin disaccharide deacetylase
VSVGVIVNADDLGMSVDVNEIAFALMKKGRITSATILANAPATHHAVGCASRFPAISFGVHLNLTQFEPLTGGAGARLLVDGRGEMTRANEAARPTPARLRAVYEELSAQVERLAALGVRISHFDSHNHVHTRPWLFPVLKQLQRRFGVRRVRLSKNLYAADAPCPVALRWKKRAYNWALRSVYRTRTTDAFTELLTYCRGPAGPRDGRSALRSIELMVHPGAPYAAEETAILENGWLRNPDTRLISYEQLP